MESLFSLEVIVNYVKINNSKSLKCLFPTVAFRLLDYPTIAINLIDNQDAKELKDKIKINEPFESIEKLPCFVELLDSHGRYIFSKGKSCLFRSELSLLKDHLKHAPMYLMILDTFFEPYKLIGSTSVPLTNLINEIYNETSEDSNIIPSSSRIDTPCIKVTYGIFDIRNLMGDDIGHISFACRLTSFGVSLLPHIDMTTEAANKMRQYKKIKETEQELKQKEKELKELEESKQYETYIYELKTNDKDKVNKNPTKYVSEMIQTVNIDYKEAQVQIIDHKITDKKDKSTQSPIIARKNSKEEDKKKETKPVIMYQVKHKQDEFTNDYFCPPPIIYNSKYQQETDQQTSANDIIEHNQYIQKRIEYLNKAVMLRHPNDDILEDEEIINENTDKVELIQNEQQNKLIQNEKFTADFNVFNQTPLLKCLFDEITKLKNFVENSQHHNKPTKYEVNSKSKNKIVGILKNPKQSSTAKITNKKNRKEHILETVNRLAQPKSEANKGKKEKKSSQQINYLNLDEVPVKENNISQDKPKKKVLKYGLTNTHRMRVLANKPNQIKKIENEHQNLLEQVKNNIDEMSLKENTAEMKITSTLEHTNTLQKNLENLLLFESIGGSTLMTSNSTKISNNNNNNDNDFDNNLILTNGSINKSNLQQLNLLNKVEMESTYGTYDFEGLNNQYKYSQNLFENENIFLKNKLNSYDYENESSDDSAQEKQKLNSTAKVVQFGNTYIYNQVDNSHSNTEEHSNSTNTSHKNDKKNIEILKNNVSIDDNEESIESKKSNASNRNIFLDNKYDDDFHSSLDSESMSSTNTKQSTSTTTTSNFFTADRKLKQKSSFDLDRNVISPRSPRILRRDAKKKHDEIDDLEGYDDIDYLTNNNNNNHSDLATSSRLSTHSYNIDSFIDEDEDDFKK